MDTISLASDAASVPNGHTLVGDGDLRQRRPSVTPLMSEFLISCLWGAAWLRDLGTLAAESVSVNDMQVLPYVAALLCTGGLMIQTARVKPGVPSGLNVILATECPVDVDIDGPLEVLSYLSDGRTSLNDKVLDREVLREEVAGRMTTRNEPILWVRAESEASYGNVMRLISELAWDTPSLHVALVTTNQGARPVDPVQLETAWKGGQRFKAPYCVRSDNWYSPVRGGQPL